MQWLKTIMYNGGGISNTYYSLRQLFVLMIYKYSFF